MGPSVFLCGKGKSELFRPVGKARKRENTIFWGTDKKELHKVCRKSDKEKHFFRIVSETSIFLPKKSEKSREKIQIKYCIIVTDPL